MSTSLPFWDDMMGFGDSEFKNFPTDSNFCSKIMNRTLLLTDKADNDRMKWQCLLSSIGLIRHH